MAGPYLLDIVDVYIKSRLNSGALGCDDHYLIIGIIEGRANAGWVSQNEGVAMAKNAADGIPAIPGLGRSAQYFSYVEMLGNQGADRCVTMSLTLELIEKLLVFGIQEVAYLFQYRDGVS